MTMGGVRRCALMLAVGAVAGVVAGCGSGGMSPGDVETQVEQQFSGDPQMVECDRAEGQTDRRYTCRVETSSDRFRYVATCAEPGRPCAIRRTGAEFK
jgi:hypothetical protein